MLARRRAHNEETTFNTGLRRRRLKAFEAEIGSAGSEDRKVRESVSTPKLAFAAGFFISGAPHAQAPTETAGDGP